MQSTLLKDQSRPFHVAIIMDGNGRWAVRRGLPRREGHREGAKAVRRVVECAPDFGVTTLTLYAFSSDNWTRPASEVDFLMQSFYEYLHAEKERCVMNGIRFHAIGRRDRLSLPLRTAMEAMEKVTADGEKLCLRIAIDYSARDSIVRAASRWNAGMDAVRETFAAALADANHDGSNSPDVDLLIRTGGEKRLSDFLLWESAYAELVFTDRMWPDFNAEDFNAAVAQFHRRERRFGGLPVPAVG